MPVIVIRTIYGEVIGQSEATVEQIDKSHIEFIELTDPRILTVIPTPQGMLSGFDRISHLMPVESIPIPFAHIVTYGYPNPKAEAGYMQEVSKIALPPKSSIIVGG